MKGQLGGGNFRWTEEAIQRLRELWAEGHTTSKIALMLGPGCTKNSVIGKAHREQLTPRVSYTVRRKPRLPSAPRIPRNPPRPVAETVEVQMQMPSPEPVVLPEPVALVEPPPTHPEPEAPPELPRTVFKPRKVTDCCWPIGEPKTPSFRFCDAVAMPGKPYCEEHYVVAYRVIQPRDYSGAENSAEAIGAKFAGKWGALRLRSGTYG